MNPQITTEAPLPLTVAEMYERNGAIWDLQIIAGEDGLAEKIDSTELSRPGLGFAGFYEVFSASRIQLVGLTESAYLRSLDPMRRRMCIRDTLSHKLPCVIVTTGERICDELLEVCIERGIALFRTSRPTSAFSYDLLHYLERRLAQRWICHGVMMDVFGLGVLIQGKSGVGKSECGLDLVERGHRLIADDIVVVRQVGKDILIAEASERLGYHMEIRGIGIIDVGRLYGERSVRSETNINMVVTLERWDPAKEYERLGLKQRQTALFNCPLPEYVLPIEPGRNIAMLIEVAALTQRLAQQGVNVAQELEKSLLADIMEKKRRRFEE